MAAQNLFTVQVPATLDGFDGGAGLTLCTLVQFAVDGDVTGIRWYFPTTALSDPPVGGLFRRDSEGSSVLLQSKAFVAPFPSGDWDEILFDTPEPVTAGQFYYAAVWCHGGFTVTSGLFTSGAIVNGDITGPQDVDPGQRNGRLAVGGAISQPTIGNGNGFFADVIFEAAAAAASGTLDVTAPAAVVEMAGTVNAAATLEVSAPAAVVEIAATSPSVAPTLNAALMNFGAIVTGIAACVTEGLYLPVCSVRYGIGRPPWDFCDCGCDGGGVGQLGIWTTPIAPSSSFPGPADPATFDRACGPPYLVATINIEIARCVPALDANAQPPTSAALLAAAMQWHEDATLVRQAVGCCLQTLRSAGRVSRFLLGQTVAADEQGGCAGSILTAQVAIPHCVCPA